MNDQFNSQNIQQTHFGNRIIQLFTDPQKAFENIKRSPNWIIPILILILSSYVFSLLTQEIQFKSQRDFILDSSFIPEEQKDEQIEQLENPSFYMKNIAPVISSLLSGLFIPTVIAAVFLLFGNLVFGGSASFLLNFCVASWAGLIGVLEGFIKLPLILNKGTLEVYTSLALVLDSAQSKTFLFQFLNIFDVFTVWKVIVYSTAFMVVYNFSKTRSYATMITLTLLMSFIGIGFAQLFYN